MNDRQRLELEREAREIVKRHGSPKEIAGMLERWEVVKGIRERVRTGVAFGESK